MRRSKVSDSSLQSVRLVQPLIAGLRKRDAALTEQLVRALTSLARSAGGAAFAQDGRKREHVLMAVASASEAAALLRLAVAWRYCPWPRAKGAYEELNRTAILLSKQARLKKPPLKAPRRAA